jgi:hypothetical protein
MEVLIKMVGIRLSIYRENSIAKEQIAAVSM